MAKVLKAKRKRPFRILIASILGGGLAIAVISQNIAPPQPAPAIKHVARPTVSPEQKKAGFDLIEASLRSGTIRKVEFKDLQVEAQFDPAVWERLDLDFKKQMVAAVIIYGMDRYNSDNVIVTDCKTGKRLAHMGFNGLTID